MTDNDGKETPKIVADPSTADGNPVDANANPSKGEFEALQKQMLDMKEKFETSEKEKVEIEKNGLFNELTSLNPKLAELNKTAEISTLKAVIKSVKALGNNFVKFDNESKVKKKAEGNAGYRLMGSDEWII